MYNARTNLGSNIYLNTITLLMSIEICHVIYDCNLIIITVHSFRLSILIVILLNMSIVEKLDWEMITL